MQGRVFSMEEFSIYDGPGIRTAVFLKGCPLRCEWCHSPEGQEFAIEILRSPNGCLRCGACLEAGKVHTGNLCLTKESIPACPQSLLRECGKDYTPEELVDVLKKNAELLRLNGGGVTFSGGEPTAQPEFLIQCLSGLQGVLHRAVQTSGYCQPQIFSDILKNCDYVLYDLKLMDPVLHRRYCGVSNQWILENYRMLASFGKDFCTRLPLIPTVNDTEENLEATARWLVENGVHYLEILPYNPLTGSKYALAGRCYSPSFDTTQAPEPRISLFRKYGIEVRLL